MKKYVQCLVEKLCLVFIVFFALYGRVEVAEIIL